jgi:hypothetical protein
VFYLAPRRLANEPNNGDGDGDDDDSDDDDDDDELYLNDNTHIFCIIIGTHITRYN